VFAGFVFGLASVLRRELLLCDAEGWPPFTFRKGSYMALRSLEMTRVLLVWKATAMCRTWGGRDRVRVDLSAAKAALFAGV
jgi:hypothetical protein